jgi:hypothetical protein
MYTVFNSRHYAQFYRLIWREVGKVWERHFNQMIQLPHRRASVYIQLLEFKKKKKC